MKKITITIIGIICGLISSIIPPLDGPGQTMHDSSLIKRVKSFNERVEAVKEKADQLAPVVADNLEKIQTVDSMLLAKKDQSVKVITRTKTVVKEKTVEKEIPVPIPVRSDEPVFIVEGQYINRPIIIQPACRIYGGGEIKYMTFSAWRAATGEKSEKKYRLYLKSLNVIK